MARIALVGNMRSGKDTFADVLINEKGYTKIAFADELKRICKELFPEQFRNGNKPREILQSVGKCMRSIDYDGLDAQIRAHKTFISELDGVDEDEIRENPQEYVKSLIEFLLGWLIDHILKVDMKIPKIT